MKMAKQKKTNEIIIQIDGKKVKAAEGMTILEAAQKADIFIPTLCHHEKLEPYGACRICTVEVEVRGWTSLVAACLYPVEKDLVVKTRSEKVDKIRKMILEFLLAHAPCSPQLKELAQEYGADRDRFEKESSFCVLCGLCVILCRGQEEKCGGICGVWCQTGDTVHPRDSRYGVHQLQRMFRALPDIVSAGRVRSNRISCVFYRFLPNHFDEITR